MKIFVVAYISFMDNNLYQTVVLADSKISAMKKELVLRGWDINDIADTVDEEELKCFAFDCDCMVSVIEVVII